MKERISSMETKLPEHIKAFRHLVQGFDMDPYDLDDLNENAEWLPIL